MMLLVHLYLHSAAKDAQATQAEVWKIPKCSLSVHARKQQRAPDFAAPALKNQSDLAERVVVAVEAALPRGRGTLHATRHSFESHALTPRESLPQRAHTHVGTAGLPTRICKN